MRIPVIRGVIDRRILANYRVDPEVLAGLLPPPFRPQRVGRFGVAGIWKSSTPACESASRTAAMPQAKAPTVPASPAPLTPNG